MKFIKTIPAVMLMACALVACDDDDQVMVQTPVTLRSQSITEGSSVVAGLTTQLTLEYNYLMSVNESVDITINGTSLTASRSEDDGKDIVIPLDLDAGTDYTISIPEGAFYNADNTTMTSEALTINFSTVEGPSKDAVSTTLCNPNASQQAQNVYEFLLESYTTYTLSGAMANVNNNNDWADLISTSTGSYPALTCYDFIHLAYSPADWIDYSDISPAQTQWDNNGLVSYMWHWLVPDNEDDYRNGNVENYAYDNDFDVEAALTEGTWQHEVIDADIAKVASYLQLLEDANIPVLWRPLHEAAGNYGDDGAWFWWGNNGVEATKQLWIYLYDKLVNEYGLDNLIWVWTIQYSEDAIDEATAAYPGDEYVDIVGVDVYEANVDSKAAQFNYAASVTNNTKMVAMSECGNVPDPEVCFASGEAWSWFMVWYYQDEDGNLVLTPDDDNFSLNTTDYLTSVMSSSCVLNREDMPSLQ